MTLPFRSFLGMLVTKRCSNAIAMTYTEHEISLIHSPFILDFDPGGCHYCVCATIL